MHMRFLFRHAVHLLTSAVAAQPVAQVQVHVLLLQ